jgi:thymidylate synthase (FAD)
MIKKIKPSVELLTNIPEEQVYKFIESAGRTCYKSEDKITPDSAKTFVKNIIKRRHLSVIEHVSLSFRVICDRGVTHELVRHRLASYSQESTRYVNYNNKDMEFIKPCFWDENDPVDKELLQIWSEVMTFADAKYRQLILNGATPEKARTVLPNSIKTEIVITANLREWLYILKLRLGPAAHPQMREVMFMIYEILKDKYSIIFNDENVGL